MSLSTSRLLWVSVFAILSHSLSLNGQANVIADPIVLKVSGVRHQIIPAETQQPITFTGLIPGELYQISVPMPEELNTCQPTISKAGSPAGENSALSFMATAEEMTFILHYPCSWNKSEAPGHYISLECRSCTPKEIKPFTGPDEILSVNPLDPEAAVREVLIGGNCFDLTGIQGTSGQVGSFSGGLTNIGFNTGVIMCTGPISIAPGPNTSDGAGGGGSGGGSDPDLATLATAGLNDICKLEFDFTPTQTPLLFEYVFASEEYCEYVNSTFNDVFGFFISGPGIAGTQNIAVIPASGGTPVAINNVNHLVNTGFYVNNQPASSGNLCGQTASSLPAVNEIQYDGFTRKFVAAANVIPCETYHIKLAIADVGDGAFDSAVFLKEGSFDAGGNASVEWVVDGNVGATETYEDCGVVQLLFDRVGGNINLPLNVSFTITGTATSGLDFAPIPFNVIIPAGQDQFLLPVNIFSDLLIEGQESIIITLNNPCSCSMPQQILYINDLPLLTTEPDTVYVCGTGVAVLEAIYEGGIDPYTFAWSNGGGFDQSAAFFVATSGNYKVTITDACGQTVVQNIRVIVTSPPKAQLFPPAPQLCANGGSGFLSITFTGTGPFELQYNLNGNPQSPIYDITDNPFLLEIFEPGLYQVTGVVDAAGCQGAGLGAQLVTESQLTLTGVPSNVQCFGQSNGSINTTVTGGQGPYNYMWTGPTAIANIPDPTNLQSGIYAVTVTDGFGCTQTNTFQIQAANVIQPNIAQVQGVNCFNPTGGSINLEVSGGFPGYSYNWSNGFTGQDPAGLAAGTFTVTITDQGGCTRTATAQVPSDQVPPVATGVAGGILNCQTLSVTVNGQGSSVGPNFNYLWSPPAPGAISGSPTSLSTTVTQGGNYILLVTNTQNGCTATATVTVTSNTAPPIAEAGAPQVLTCAITNVTLNGNGSSSGNNNFSYFWTASNGGVISGGPNTLTPIVSATGTYTLTVTNLTNFCTSSDQVIVTANTTPPVAMIAPAGQINCTQSTVTLNAGASTPSNVVYSWNTLNGNIISGNSSPNPVVSEAGDYTVVVTNPQNGCTDDASVVVTIDQTAPVAIAIVNGEINCTTSQLTINASGSSSAGTFSWTAGPGANIVSGGNTLTPVVNAPGLYTLLVTNPANNCSASASVQVTENKIPPVAVAGPPATINCYNPTLIVGDPNTFILPGTQYQWTASNGGQISGPANLPSASVTNSGTYTLLVTNTINGCTNSASVTIAKDNAPPTAVIAPAGQINCTTPVIQLSGSGSSTGPVYVYQWTTVDGVIAAGGTTLNPAVSADGTYQLVVTNNVNGCTSTATATVTANLNLPNVTIATANPITCNVTQITLNANGSSTGSNFGYQWGTIDGVILSGANSLMPTVGNPGTYTLIVTNTNNNCTATQNVIVPANNVLPAASAGAPQTLDCNVPTLSLNGTGASGPNIVYQWTTAGGNIISGANSLNPVIDLPGTYTLQVTNNATGCTNTAAVLVNQDAGEPVVLVAPPATLTCAVTQTTINGTGSSTGGNFSYAWSGPGIVSGGTSLNPTINVDGQYTLVITNTDNGCTNEAIVAVDKDIEPPVADAGPDNTLNCYQPELQIGGTTMSTGPQFTYNWVGSGIVSGATSATPVINQPGMYNVTVTNTENGCSTTDVINLDVNFVTPQVEAGPDFTLTCVENFYQTAPVVTGSGPFTYKWTTNTGSILGSSTALAPILNGVGYYYLTVTNTVSGCTASDQLQITQSSEFPDAVAGQPAVLTCAVTQLNLNGNGSSTGLQYVYEWVPTVGGNIVSGANTLNPLVNEPGTYTLSVRDTFNSCITYSSVIISENIALPVIDAGAAVTLTCTTETLNLDGEVSSNGTFGYDWTAANGGNILSGANTLTPLVNAVGTYNLVVTNTVNGCTSSDQVNVLADQNAPVIAIAVPDTLNCIFGSIFLDATASSSGNNFEYTWTTSNGHIVDLSNPSKIKVDEPGLYQLVIVNQDNNCASLASVDVSQDIVKPIANAGADDVLDCANIVTVLDGSGSSASGNYFYQWTTPNGEIISGANTLAPTVTAAGSYLLTVLNTDNGCSSNDLAVVNQNTLAPDIAIIIPALITCFSPEVVLDGSNSDNGPDYSYAWTTPNGNILSGTDALQAVVNAPGSYTLTVLNNLNGCANASTTQVEENTVSPSVNILPPAVLTCAVPEVQVIALAESGSQYVFGWTTQNGHIVSGASTLSLKVDKPGNYSILIVNNQNGCAALANANVIEITNKPNDFEFTLKLPGCRDNDGSVRFDTVIGGISPYLYSLNGGDTYSTTLAFGSLGPGVYDLIVQDINGCEYTESIEIPQAIDPAINIAPQFYISLGDSLNLEAKLPPGFPLDLIDTITWTPLDYLEFSGTSIAELLTPKCKPLHTVKYEVRIISKNGGCEASDRVLIIVDSEPKVYIPNVFTPDDPTGENSIFMIYADDERDQIKQINSFQIFDRWGEMVHQAQNFKPNDPAYGWNGRLGSGKQLTPAVFVYYAVVELIDGRIILYEGDVTLVR